MNNRFSVFLRTACVTFSLSVPFVTFANDGLGGLALLLLVGFGLAFGILGGSIFMVIHLFSSSPKETQENETLLSWWKIIPPIVIAVGVNAIMVQGYIGLSGFLNIVNGLFIGCLFVVFFLSSKKQRQRNTLMCAWGGILIMVVYAFVGYLFLGW